MFSFLLIGHNEPQSKMNLKPRSTGSMFSLIFFFSFSRQAEEAVSCDPVCENSCEKISVQIPPKDGKIAENEEERKRQPIVTESIEVQTEPITVEELLSFQQQKL